MDSLAEEGGGVNLAPVTFEKGERIHKLTVLEKWKSDNRGPRWRVGCECGWQFNVSARKLMRGEVKACLKCSGRSTR